MLGRFAAFEFRYQLLSPMFVVVTLAFFLITFVLLAVPEAAGALSATAHLNSPFTISLVTLSLGVYGIFIPTAFLSGAVLRDRHFGTEPLFFTRPVSEFGYLTGRFLGAFAVTCLVFAAVPLAAFLASLAPWIDEAMLGPVRPLDYVYAYVVLGVPNLLVPGALMFTVANLTRSNMLTYTAALAFFLLYLIGSLLTSEAQYRTLVGLLDPFGVMAFTEVTRYWTPAEMNSRLIPLDGLFLWNRLLWIGVALALLGLNIRLFSFRASGWTPWRRKQQAAPATPAPAQFEMPKVQPQFGPLVAFRQFLLRVRYEMGLIVRGVSFWVLLAFGVLLVCVVLFNLQLLYGTPVLPVTRVLAELAAAQFSLVPMIVLIYFASELVWRDRINRAHEILDATPTPSWAFVFAKLVAMWAMLAALFCVAIATAVIAQLVIGGAPVELDLYLTQMLLIGPYNLYLIAALSVFVQVLANNRYLGMALMVAYIVVRTIIGNLGFGHNLYLFPGTSAAPYSDMNGYGHFLVGRFWFELYWTLFAGILVALTFALWNRGTLSPVWRRFPLVPRRLGAAGIGAVAVLLVAFAATGGFIFYNTNVLNPFFMPSQLRDISVEYEERYRQYEDATEPRLTAVDVDVDIYPYERRYRARGVYTVSNASDAPIETMHVDYDYALDVNDQQVEGGRLAEADDEYSFYTLAFDTPLKPGESRDFRFDVSREWPGFTGGGNGGFVIWNGSFFNNFQALPQIGFNPRKMLQDPGRRRGRGLDEIDRMPKLEDEDAARENYIAANADWLEFHATVSTTPDQIAIAPGQLQREWEEDGRRYFEYRMQSPIVNFFAFLSGRFAVEEAERDGVTLQVFYHPDHTYNVERMVEAMGDSIAYFSDAFSPFQHRQMRIFEFPAFFGQFAQSFPNTVPYSEGAGFIMDNRDPDKIDYVYYITAHETAHQWWAHQLIGANVQGATMLSETFAQYSALMLMEKEFGEHHIRRFLKYELDRYLASRGGERIEELPLYRVENQQYIHYQKGSLVMYALRDYLGEATVNRALSRLLDEHAYRSDPYPRSTDFLDILRQEAGPEHDGLIEDLFEKIVLFDLRATDLQVTERPDGRFDVRLTAEAKKLEADGEGEETEVPLDYMIDIGLFTEHPDQAGAGDDHVLVLEKRRVTSGENVFTFTVDAEPVVGGIDPYIKLIDRSSEDNLRRVDSREGGDAVDGGQNADAPSRVDAALRKAG